MFESCGVMRRGDQRTAVAARIEGGCGKNTMKKALPVHKLASYGACGSGV